MDGYWPLIAVYAIYTLVMVGILLGWFVKAPALQTFEEGADGQDH